jgi:hypothetical protein
VSSNNKRKAQDDATTTSTTTTMMASKRSRLELPPRTPNATSGERFLDLINEENATRTVYALVLPNHQLQEIHLTVPSKKVLQMCMSDSSVCFLLDDGAVLTSVLSKDGSSPVVQSPASSKVRQIAANGPHMFFLVKGGHLFCNGVNMTVSGLQQEKEISKCYAGPDYLIVQYKDYTLDFVRQKTSSQWEVSSFFRDVTANHLHDKKIRHVYTGGTFVIVDNYSTYSSGALHLFPITDDCTPAAGPILIPRGWKPSHVAADRDHYLVLTCADVMSSKKQPAKKKTYGTRVFSAGNNTYGQLGSTGQGHGTVRSVRASERLP